MRLKQVEVLRRKILSGIIEMISVTGSIPASELIVVGGDLNDHSRTSSITSSQQLMAQSEESLRDKIVQWKSGLEAKGLKMNTGKTKVVV